jgi:hypothetical protein
MSKTFKVGSAAIGAFFLAAGITLVLPGAASAHSDDSSVSCEGLHVVVNDYPQQPEPNSVTVTVNGSTQSFSFQQDFDQFFPFDSQEQNSWSYQIDAPGTERDRSRSGTMNGCDYTTTTTTEPTTTEPTTTEPTTTEPTTSTEPTTTEPTTTSTEPTTTAPPSTMPSTSADPTTSAPTTQPSVGVSSTRGAKVVGRPPATLGVSLGQLPETGTTVAPTIAVASTFVAVGAAAVLAGRRHSAAR